MLQLKCRGGNFWEIAVVPPRPERRAELVGWPTFLGPFP